ncbi:hypothetical protein G7077_13385 [Sphingomonas piscis]|uniref:Uncharacterized protein n=1 Tax=Sphingomonas piscis TaxID=2714943 RepID=A0A6G7YSN7_9SPHN|nr:hypothetical protein [Sphingomonas piscis]QIK79749.1 hypothetical protein G7077_13385 [Sphingomonas piscis]
MLKVAFAAPAVLSAVLMSQVAVAQGSPARANQEVFDVSNKESDYFENTFRNATPQGGDTYANVLRFATCAARLNPAGVAAILNYDAGSSQELGAIRDLTKRYGSCAITRRTIQPVMLRGAVAEILWKQAGADPNPSKRSSVGIEEVEDFIQASPRGEQKFKAANLALSWVSRCQVMALPTEAAAVLSTTPNSLEERAAAQALYAKSTTCGVVKGLEKTPPTLVRAGLADAFYQDRRKATMASAR